MISAWSDNPAMSGSKIPFDGVGTTVLGTNVLIVVSLGQGIIRLGQVVTGIGIPAGTVVSDLGVALGGIGIYILSNNTGLGAGTGAISINV